MLWIRIRFARPYFRCLDVETRGKVDVEWRKSARSEMEGIAKECGISLIEEDLARNAEERTGISEIGLVALPSIE